MRYLTVTLVVDWSVGYFKFNYSSLTFVRFIVRTDSLSPERRFHNVKAAFSITRNISSSITGVTFLACHTALYQQHGAPDMTPIFPLHFVPNVCIRLTRQLSVYT